LGNLSARDSNIKDPMPEPVPPAIEWHKTKPYTNSIILKKNYI